MLYMRKKVPLKSLVWNGDRQEAIEFILNELGQTDTPPLDAEISPVDTEVSSLDQAKVKSENIRRQREKLHKEKQQEIQSFANETAFYTKISDYTILRHKYYQGLVEDVRKAMRKGWIPYGGVSFVAAGTSVIGHTGNSFIQALVKIHK